MPELINHTNSSDTPKDATLWCRQENMIPFWICIIVVCFSFGFPAAVAVLWDMIQRARKGDHFTPYDVFVFNATLIDGIYLFFSIPGMLNYLGEMNWEYETFMMFLFSFNLCGRPLIITCICVDCYLAVVHPVVYHANKSLTPRIIAAVGVWTVTLIYGALCVRYIHVRDALIQVIFFALTLPVIGFCDVSIFWTLKRSNPAGGSVHPKKKRALQVIINNLVVTYTSYLPLLVGILVPRFVRINNLVVICNFLAILWSSMLVGNTVSPILYVNNLGKLNWLKCLWHK